MKKNKYFKKIFGHQQNSETENCFNSLVEVLNSSAILNPVLGVFCYKDKTGKSSAAKAIGERIVEEAGKDNKILRRINSYNFYLTEPQSEGLKELNKIGYEELEPSRLN